MSSPDRSRRRLVLALAASAILAACQARPLYAPGPGGSASPAVAELGRIAIEVQKDRPAQALMNELIFALRGGAPLVDPAYTLKLIVTTRKTELAIRESDEVPAANLISMTATYTLTETVTGRVVTNGTTYATVSYDFSSQRFANLRAERDAEDRAARTTASDIRLRLAAALAEDA
jgi:LPS-assembly lipoprotein